MTSWQEMFSSLLALRAGNQRWPVNSPHKGLVMLSFDISFVASLDKPLNKQLIRQ